jgi:hypothetical protein
VTGRVTDDVEHGARQLQVGKRPLMEFYFAWFFTPAQTAAGKF